MKVTLFERDDQEGYEYEPNGEVLRPERVVIDRYAVAQVQQLE